MKKLKNFKKRNESGRKENELSKQIDLSCGFGELRRNLEDFEEMEKWKANEEIERQEEIENQPPTIQEENVNELRMEFLEREENGGGRSRNKTQRETNDEI